MRLRLHWQRTPGPSDRILTDYGNPLVEGLVHGLLTVNEARGLPDGDRKNCKVCGAPGQLEQCRYCRHWRETPKRERIIVGRAPCTSSVFVAPLYMVDSYAREYQDMVTGVIKNAVPRVALLSGPPAQYTPSRAAQPALLAAQSARSANTEAGRFGSRSGTWGTLRGGT